jgi:NodT family efflux transporter outer membrane factor (OMF) lipoprotein
MALLAGCMVGPNYQRPNIEMPSAFVAGGASTRPTTHSAASPATRPIDLALWWESLDDVELNSLVVRAIAANPGLEIAMTRLQEARMIQAALWGTMLPSAEVRGAAARGTGNNSVKGRDGPILDSGTNTSGVKEITEVMGFDATWEIDLFGKARRALEAADADAAAANDARNAVLITLVSDVARAYMDVRTLQLRLAIVNATVLAEQRTLAVVQTRFDKGITNELDVALARRQLATVESQVPLLEESITQSQRRVAVLLGLFPEQLSQELGPTQALPHLPDAIVPGLPVELLRRRPDIRQAERQLAAQTARIGVATAELFPTVALTGGAGFDGQGLGRKPMLTNYIWSFGPSAYWPLLDFGTLDALVSVQDLETHAALMNYKQTILVAVEEVNNAIANFAAQRRRLVSLDQAVVAGQLAVQRASERYESGVTNLLDVIDAQRQYYDLQDQYAQAREAMVLQFIAVYKGLGGGWEEFVPAAPPPAPRPAIIAAGARLLHPAAPAAP